MINLLIRDINSATEIYLNYFINYTHVLLKQSQSKTFTSKLKTKMCVQCIFCLFCLFQVSHTCAGVLTLQFLFQDAQLLQVDAAAAAHDHQQGALQSRQPTFREWEQRSEGKVCLKIKLNEDDSRVTFILQPGYESAVDGS